MTTYRNPDENGYYGEFGGAFVPEMLYPNVEELQQNYIEIIESEEFKKELNDLLKDYVGRATPLYFAKNLSKKYGTNVYLKREDLNHTGAHKINNALGQVLLAKKLGKKRIIAETGAGQHGVATATACALMNYKKLSTNNHQLPTTYCSTQTAKLLAELDKLLIGKFSTK